MDLQKLYNELRSEIKTARIDAHLIAQDEQTLVFGHRYLYTCLAPESRVKLQFFANIAKLNYEHAGVEIHCSSFGKFKKDWLN